VGTGGFFLRTQQSQNKSEKQASPDNNETKVKGSTFSLTIASFKVGCHVNSSLQGLRHPHHAWFTAIQGTHGNPRRNQVHFDSDSFPIGVDNHPSYCMVNSPHLLENIILSDVDKVDGINEGLEI
jgi:hypothetical protein